VQQELFITQNQSSLSKKIVLKVALILLLLNILAFVTIIMFNKETIYNMEREKAQLIAHTYSPILAMRLYLEMEHSFERIAKQILENKSVLQVTVISNDKVLYHYASEQKDGIEVTENIYMPEANKKIGTLKLLYSTNNYKQLLKKNLTVLSIFLLLFIMTFIALGWYIKKFLKPLNKLAKLLKKCRLDKEVNFPYTQRNDEIGAVSKALESMHKRIIKQTQERNRHEQLLIAQSQELENLNKTLDKRVQEELAKNRQKEQQLIHQSRLAQMGEMISMIAHQWRQPLTAISATTSNLLIRIMMDDINKDEFEKDISLISKYSQHLSKTIDDFRGFFKENKIPEATTLNEIVLSTLDIVKISVENANIELKTKLKCDKKLRTYPSEIKQVLLNLIKNAQDAHVEQEIKDAFIEIETKCHDDKYILIVRDNAGGIPEKIIDKVFEPYFSTKLKKDGTGLGLYMSKTIIQQHCGGEIEVQNDDAGAVFKITL
jgi:C4-dicarboxylate-specific signal transduction histidine kinase